MVSIFIIQCNKYFCLQNYEKKVINIHIKLHIVLLCITPNVYLSDNAVKFVINILNETWSYVCRTLTDLIVRFIVKNGSSIAFFSNLIPTPQIAYTRLLVYTCLLVMISLYIYNDPTTLSCSNKCCQPDHYGSQNQTKVVNFQKSLADFCD